MAAKKKSRYIICRSNMGVHSGVLDEAKSTETVKVLLKPRRLWRWHSRFTLTELALEGPVKPDQCKFSAEGPTTEITSPTNGFEILECTDAAMKAILAVPACQP